MDKAAARFRAARPGHRLDRFTYVVMEPAHPLAVPVLIPASA